MENVNSKTLRIRRITESLISLPTLPTVISKMIELVDNPKTSAASLARLISADQALTARLLKLANSAYYGFSREISTVNMAIVVLGFNAVREMGLSLSVFDVFKKAGTATSVFDISRFWTHSIGCGIASKMLARKVGHNRIGEAFVAGLLHDVGKAILNQYMHSEFSKIIGCVESGKMDLDEAEVEITGTTHGQIGGWLAEKWRLPSFIVEAISFHHTPQNARIDQSLVALVTVANHLCHICGIGASGRKEPRVLTPELWRILDSTPVPFNAEDIETLSNDFLLEFDQAGPFISFLEHEQI